MATVFPQAPHLKEAYIKDGREYRVLTEDHITHVQIGLGLSLEITVKAGYVTDGASIPKCFLSETVAETWLKKVSTTKFPDGDFETIWKWLVGTPWDMPRLNAAIPHDALYSIHWGCRWLCDFVYKNILSKADYDPVRREIEYDAIRLVGWKNWDAVSQEEIEAARNFVSVKWVWTKKTDNIKPERRTRKAS